MTSLQVELLVVTGFVVGFGIMAFVMALGWVLAVFWGVVKG